MARMTKREQERYKETLKLYNRLAKRADDRMRALENKAMNTEGFENILSYAYRGAEKVIERWGGSNRWRSNTPKRLAGLKNKIKDIEYFLSRPTSSVRETKKIYEKRAESLNKTLNEGLLPGEPRVNFTWEDMAKFFESGAFQKLQERNYDSKTVFKMIWQRVHKKKEMRSFKKSVMGKDLEQTKKDTVYAATYDSVDSMLRSLGVKLGDFFA